MNQITNVQSFEPAVSEEAINLYEKQRARKESRATLWQNCLLFVCAVIVLVLVNPTVCLDEPIQARPVETEPDLSLAEVSVEKEPEQQTPDTDYQPVHNEEIRYEAHYYPLYSITIEDLFGELAAFRGMPDTFYYNLNGWNQGSILIPEKKQPEEEEPQEEEQPEEEQPVEEPVVYSISEGARTIYNLSGNYALLTFDDGPSIYTKQIVDILNKYGIKGAFFFIGVHTNGFYEQMKYVSDHGCIIGNHTYSHREMSLKTIEEQKDEIIRTNQIIEDATGLYPKYFRPPYGNLNENLKNILHGKDMKTILWNKDPADWDNKTGEEIIQYITDTQPYGGIYLLHETAETVAALPMIIEFLLAQNVEFVTLE